MPDEENVSVDEMECFSKYKTILGQCKTNYQISFQLFYGTLYAAGNYELSSSNSVNNLDFRKAEISLSFVSTTYA